MPSIIPSYLYTFAALITVSTLLICSFSSYATNLRVVPEIEQFKNLLDRVMANGNELLTLVVTTNSTTQLLLQLPSRIGNREYWMRLYNGSSTAWLEGGLGKISERPAELRVFFPGKVSASGYYIGGYGPAMLECYMNGSVPQLNLNSLGGSPSK